MKIFYRLIISSVFIATLIGCKSLSQKAQSPEPNRLYGIIADGYTVEQHEVHTGDTWGNIFNSLGITQPQIAQLEALAADVSPLRKIVAGKPYTTFFKVDSLSRHMDYLVYEKTAVDYVVFAFAGDSLAVYAEQKPMRVVRSKRTAKITSSLWGAISASKMPDALAAEIEDIYQWSIDFFGLQEGDEFTVIYDEKYVDTLSVGIGQIWGAKFRHAGKDIYAIPFKQGGKLKYWEYDGASLRKQLLKAPLKFTRISSTYSNARFHPVLKVYRPHHGVDYAAPSGTPVRTVADGTVIYKGNSGAGGNMVKIKHAGNLTSGYMHLRGYAKGLHVGSRVSQGQLIGYVGSTGRSTGPHLDFRLWKGSSPINPLKIPQTPAEPIAKANREKFEWVRDCIAAELEGEVADSMRITQVDTVILPRKATTAESANTATTKSKKS